MLRHTPTASTTSTERTEDMGPQAPSRWSLPGLTAGVRAVGMHLLKHTGVGIVCAVAYFDPGNWGVDLQAGSEYGYKLLFVVLLAGLFAIYMQVLASRLGCVTGLDLASHCRLLLHDRPRYTLLWRWGVLYPLYALSEIAIISTDLAELLGSAMALVMLFPKLEIWAGVLITTADVLLLLAMRNPIGGEPVRAFELGIAALVFIVLICMAVIISKTEINWGNAFFGFVPSETVFESGGLYTSIGIIGATVMPHSLFLGSALATQDRVASPPPRESPASRDADAPSEGTLPSVRNARTLFRKLSKSFWAMFKVKRIEDQPNEPKSHAEWTNSPLSFIRQHLTHGIVDMVISLLGLAVVINALILILAGAVFFFNGDGSDGPADLFDAYDLLRDRLGAAAATLFALALLAAGQSSSIIATLAAQIVSEGFIHWSTSPVLTRLITRCFGLIPSLIVAIAVGRPGIATLLVASQVVLSIVLPFVTFPLILLTSSKQVMTVYEEAEPAPTTSSSDTASASEQTTKDESVKDEIPVDFSNGKIMIAIGVVIWIIIVIANVYVLVQLGRGQV
ncbi:natural resistance-associated macrophage protein [Ganoderma leucocontextum]|nr:natural resistance-associated macrophage protein [Ganoderma leucocontextum]